MLYLPLESLFSKNTLEELKEIFGNTVTDRPHNELIILALALTEGEVSNVSLQNMVELHPSDLTKLLRKMCKENLIVNSGFGRGTTYKLNRDYVASSNHLASSDLASSSTNIQSINVKSASNLASSDIASSSNLACSNLASSDTNIQPLNFKPKTDLASSDVASSTHLASSDLASSEKRDKAIEDENAMSMIREYCKLWTSAKNISLKIGRHPTYTREILKRMLNEGIIEQEYPNQPTHPAQRYRVKK